MPMKRKSYGGRFTPLVIPLSKKPRRPNVSVGLSQSTRLHQAMKAVEYKYLDSNLSSSVISSSLSSGMKDPTTVACLNAVPQGDTSSSRDGRKYTITGCHVRGVFYRQNRNDQTQVGDANFVTYALVLDRQTNGAQATSDEIFSSPSNAALCFQNLENTQRFKVLYKGTMDIPAGSPAYNGVANQLETGGVSVPFSLDKKLNITVNTSGTGANVTDITDNSLHFVAFAGFAGAGADSIELSYTCRIRFVG